MWNWIFTMRYLDGMCRYVYNIEVAWTCNIFRKDTTVAHSELSFDVKYQSDFIEIYAGIKISFMIYYSICNLPFNCLQFLCKIINKALYGKVTTSWYEILWSNLFFLGVRKTQYFLILEACI